jgi:hypothetical protein
LNKHFRSKEDGKSNFYAIHVNEIGCCLSV